MSRVRSPPVVDTKKCSLQRSAQGWQGDLLQSLDGCFECGSALARFVEIMLGGRRVAARAVTFWAMR